jgi:hypothetical protein
MNFFVRFQNKNLTFLLHTWLLFFNKTCPYKITDRKIIKIEHNIIDNGRCLKLEVFSETFLMIA